MPAPLLSNEALVIRQGAAWNEYQRDHVPGNTRRQVFTGGDKVTDQTATSHEAVVVKLVDTAFSTWAQLRQASQEKERVHFRSTVKKTLDS
jgi:hypothetical protein